MTFRSIAVLGRGSRRAITTESKHRGREEKRPKRPDSRFATSLPGNPTTAPGPLRGQSQARAKRKEPTPAANQRLVHSPPSQKEDLNPYSQTSEPVVGSRLADMPPLRTLAAGAVGSDPKKFCDLGRARARAAFSAASLCGGDYRSATIPQKNLELRHRTH